MCSKQNSKIKLEPDLNGKDIEIYLIEFKIMIMKILNKFRRTMHE